MDFIIEQILFYFAIIVVLFLPGWFLMMAFFKERTSKLFSPIEKFVISFGLSIISVDFLMILMGRANISLTRWSIILAIILFSIVCWVIKNNFKLLIFNFKTIFNNKIFNNKIKNLKFKNWKTKNLNSRTVLIILILFLTIFIKTVYLKDTIFPTSTDLGHHMYWSKLISQTGELPTYEKLKIIETNTGYTLQTENIADFIIGEHLIFSAINLISGIPFISYFPTLVLFLINIMCLLALFILTLRLFENYKFSHSRLLGKNIAILTLLLAGPLYTLASPQAKFVSGGVVGNLLGNLFIPLALYFYFRAFKNPTTKKSYQFLMTALFITMGLFYTHHLSGLIFLFITIFIITTYIVLILIKNTKYQILNARYYFKLIFSPSIIIFLLLASFYLLLIYTPSYLNTDATGTAIGAPSKSTRIGLTPTQFKYAIGEPILALGIIGLILLFFQTLKKNKSQINKNNKSHTANYLLLATLLGWVLAVSLMTLKPHWLHINIPSGRVANYANFPFIIIASFTIVWLAYSVQNLRTTKTFLPTRIISIFFSLLCLTFLSAGYYDNSQSLIKNSNNQSALKTFHASEYLAKNSEHFSKKSMLLKDHNHIKADTWIKLFFMKDYSYPLSRGFFKRYNDPTKPREMCTLWMIESPSSEKAQQCYQDTQTKFIMINPNPDGIQFKKDENFWKIYSGNEINIFYKK